MIQELKSLEALLSETFVVLFVFHPNGDYHTIFVSDNVASVFGYNPQDYLNDANFWQKGVHPEDLPAILADFPEMGRRNHTIYEYRFRHKDGHYCWVHEEIKLMKDSEGNPTEIIGFQMDITEKKVAEEKLRWSLEEHSILINNLDIQLWYLTDPETLGIVNKAYGDFLGKSVELLNNQKLRDVLGENGANISISTNRQVFEQKSKIIIKEWWQNYKGEDRLFRIEKTPKIDQNGNVDYVICIGTDITEQHEAEKLLKISEERYRAIVQDQTELICRWKPNKVLTFVNNAYCSYIGKSKEELIGFCFTLLMPLEDQKIMESNITKISLLDPIIMYEHKIKLSNGEVRWQHWTDRGIFNSSGELVEIQSVGRDITIQKNIELELKKAREDLENRVKERTSQLEKANSLLMNENIERTKAERLLERRLSFEKAIYQAAAGFVGVYDIDGVIGRSIKEIGLLFQIERTYLCLFDAAQTGVISKTYEWCQPDVKPHQDLFLKLSGDYLPWLFSKLKTEDLVLINSIGQLPREASKEKRFFLNLSVRSLILIPLKLKGQILGLFGMVNINGEDVWEPDNLQIFKHFTQILTSALERKQFEDDLKKSENYYRTIFETTWDATIILEEDLTISLVNKKFVELCEFEKEEVERKKNWLDFIVKPNPAVLWAMAKKRAEYPHVVPRSYEAQIRVKSGEIKDIYVLVDMIPGTKKRVVSFIDISQIKRTEEKLQNSIIKLEYTLENTIYSMAKLVEVRDPYTSGHQKRVAELAKVIALNLGLPEEEVRAIYLAALVHDIGKIYVPAEILSKPCQLNPNEYSLIKLHPNIGYDILSTIDFPWPIADMVLQHHERINGTGYPNGLTGDEIMIGARIISVSDTVEAMSSHRPYRSAVGIKKALKEISCNMGILYEAQVVEACLKVFKEGKFKF